MQHDMECFTDNDRLLPNKVNREKTNLKTKSDEIVLTEATTAPRPTAVQNNNKENGVSLPPIASPRKQQNTAPITTNNNSKKEKEEQTNRNALKVNPQSNHKNNSKQPAPKPPYHIPRHSLPVNMARQVNLMHNNYNNETNNNNNNKRNNSITDSSTTSHYSHSSPCSPMSHRSNSKDSTDCNHNRERKLLVANNTNNLLKFVASEEAEKEDGATVNSNNTNTSKKKISSSPLVKHTSGTNNNNNGLFYASTTTTNSEELFLIHSSSLLEASLHRPHSNNTSNSSSFSMSSDPLRQNNNIYVKELVKELREIYLDLHRNENTNKNNMTREDLFNMIEVLQFPVEDVGLFIDLFDELLLVKQNIFQHFDSAAHNGSLSVNTAPTNNNNNNKGNASSTIASGNAALPPAAPRPPALNANSFPSSTEREMFLQGGSSKSNNSMANHKDNEDTLDVETFLAHVVLRIKGKFSSESLRTLFFDLADKYNTSNNNNNNNNNASANAGFAAMLKQYNNTNSNVSGARASSPLLGATVASNASATTNNNNNSTSEISSSFTPPTAVTVPLNILLQEGIRKKLLLSPNASHGDIQLLFEANPTITTIKDKARWKAVLEVVGLPTNIDVKTHVCYCHEFIRLVHCLTEKVYRSHPNNNNENNDNEKDADRVVMMRSGNSKAELVQ